MNFERQLERYFFLEITFTYVQNIMILNVVLLREMPIKMESFVYQHDEVDVELFGDVNLACMSSVS